MTPLPSSLGESNELVAWRLDREIYKTTWDSGEGAYRDGGRWNSKRVRAVYCALDPATAILEVAVHKGFDALDVVPHVLSSVTIKDPSAVRVVRPNEVVANGNPNWLRPGSLSPGQQRFGDELLTKHKFVALPSVVSTHSWNLIFVAERAAGAYALKDQERFALDTRLNPVVN
jgi:RES domain-containing protein